MAPGWIAAMADNSVQSWLSSNPLATGTPPPATGKAPAAKTPASEPAGTSVASWLSADPTQLPVSRETPDEGSAIKGTLEGAANVVTGAAKFLSGATGYADIADLITGNDKTSKAVADFLHFDPTEMKTAAAQKAVEGAAGTLMSIPGKLGAEGGRELALYNEWAIKKLGRPLTMAEQAKLEGMLEAGGNVAANIATLFVGGKGAKSLPDRIAQTPEDQAAALKPVEETEAPPPAQGGTPAGYQPPDIVQVMRDKRLADQKAASDKVVSDIAATRGETTPQIEPGGRRATSGVYAEVRKAYDSLSEAEKENTRIQDGLTGALSTEMYRKIGGADRPQVFFDLRNFKSLQEPAGKAVSHGFGDEILKTIGAEAKAQGIPLFRYAGDEFSILGDRATAMDAVRRLQTALKNHVIRYTAKDGTVYETQGINLDAGWGKNRDAADAASSLAKKAAKAAGSEAEGTVGGLAETPAEGRPAGSDTTALTRSMTETGVNQHTPLPHDVIPPDYTLNKIRFHLNDKRDTVVPVRTIFEEPGDSDLLKLGEETLKQAGESAEPRPNTATPEGQALVQGIRQYIQQYHPAWAQNDLRANLAYARDFAREVRDYRTRGYNAIRDHLEQTHPANPRGELRAHPGRYAFETRVPRYQPRDTIVKCF